MYHHHTPVHLTGSHPALPLGTGPRAGSRELSLSRAAVRRHAVAEALRSRTGDAS